MKTKVLAINQIIEEKETYPRFNFDFVTKARYYHAMKSGAVFPPVCVGFLNGKYYLIDGKHRIEAMKNLNQTHVSAEILKVNSKQEIYLEAVKRNIGHGKQFSTQEVTNIIITLERWNMSLPAISNLIRIPATDIKPFVAQRMTRVVGADGSVEEVALKATLKHLAGTSQEAEVMEQQASTNARSQLAVLNAVISWLENGVLDVGNEIVVNKLLRLNELIRKSSFFPVQVQVTTPKKRGRPKKTK